MASAADFDRITCPTPQGQYERVLLGHGSGGKLSRDLLARVFLADLGQDAVAALEDSATLPLDPLNAAASDPRIAFTTDSYVVKPLFFPGGDIGKLAVYGTVNDLAVSGARPVYLAASFILEEGFVIEQLQRIVDSMREACRLAAVTLVTGDTKVVDRGSGDEVFITTAGIGVQPPEVELSICNARPGDQVIVSGTIGDHGITIMSTRQGLEFETTLESDTAPLNGLSQLMLNACPSIRLMRDPTRGGVSSTLHELASASGVGVVLDEAAIPIRREVHAACEMLGLDPLYVANEGKLIVVAPARDTGGLLKVIREHPLGRDAAIIGEVVSDHAGMVVIRSRIGGKRVVAQLAGEQLPRIC